MLKNYTKFSFAVVMSLLLLLLAGCGSKNVGSSSPTTSPVSKPTEEERVIKHALGETSITGIPQKIVVLEWTYAEDLLAVGVQPIGVADIENMKKWLKLPLELSASVQDVGTRQEPNLEVITTLEPDLIIGVKFRHEAIATELNAIAPTIMFDPYPAEDQGDQYKEMVETFSTIAEITGKKLEAEAYLSQLQAKYDELKEKLSAAGKEGQEIILAMPLVNQNAVSFRLSTDNSLAIKVLEQIGLRNAYQSEQFEVYGFATKDVEAFPSVQHADYLHITQDEIINDKLANNSVWRDLTFIKENRSYALGGDTWPYGGPYSAQLLAERVAGVLIGE